MAQDRQHKPVWLDNAQLLRPTTDGFDPTPLNNPRAALQ
jgi:hypothetical protein